MHHVNGIPIDFSPELFDRALASLGGDLESLFCAYFDLQYDMLQAVRPNVVGHFDLIRLFRPSSTWSAKVLQKIERNAKFVAEIGALVELNSSGLRKGLPGPYPMADTLAVLMRSNCRFTLSDDSHRVEHVAVKYRELRDYLREHGVNTVYALRRSRDGQGLQLAQYDDITNHAFWDALPKA